jgi:hypothetical protein
MATLQRLEPQKPGCRVSWTRAIFASACSTPGRNLLSARNFLTVMFSVVVVLAISVVVVTFWTSLGNSDISAAGWVAMGFGITFTLALGIGLMALVFISSRQGYDERGRHGDAPRPQDSGD